MTGKGKRRRADTVVGSSDMFPPQSNRVYPNDPLAPATKQDKLTWKGYCEIESEPVSIPLSHMWNRVLRGCMIIGRYGVLRALANM